MGGISQPSGIGVGQTWQNLTASRSIGVTYTNLTSKPIMVSVSPVASAALIGTFSINSVVVANIQFTPAGGGGGSPFVFIIPPNATYSVNNVTNFNLDKWFELS